MQGISIVLDFSECRTRSNSHTRHVLLFHLLVISLIPSISTTSFWLLIQRCSDVDNVKTTSCAYWVRSLYHHLLLLRQLRNVSLCLFFQAGEHPWRDFKVRQEKYHKIQCKCYSVIYIYICTIFDHFQCRCVPIVSRSGLFQRCQVTWWFIGQFAYRRYPYGRLDLFPRRPMYCAVIL